MQPTASRKSALRNTGSCWRLLLIVSLKLFVRAIISLAFVPCIPAGASCSFDIGLLADLTTSAQKNDEPFAILAKIDPITGAEVHAQLIHARTNRFDRRVIAPFEPVKEDNNSCLNIAIQSAEPVFEGIAPQKVDVLANLNHADIVPQKTPRRILQIFNLILPLKMRAQKRYNPL